MGVSVQERGDSHEEFWNWSYFDTQYISEAPFKGPSVQVEGLKGGEEKTRGHCITNKIGDCFLKCCL